MPRDKENLKRWRKEWYEKRKADPNFTAKKNAYNRELYRRKLAEHPRAFRKHVNAKARKWQTANRAYYKRYRAERKEQYREYIKNYMRAWRKGHKKNIHAINQDQYRKKPDLYKHHAQIRRARKIAAIGTHTRKEWMEKVLMHRWLCSYCGASLTIKTLVKEHVIPLSRGGTDDIQNLAPSCRPCNQSKHALPLEEFLRRQNHQ